MWTERELEYIRKNEYSLEKAKLPLSPDQSRSLKLCSKLNIALAILRGEKFKLAIYNSRDPLIRIVYLQYSISKGVRDGLNIAFDSFKEAETATMRPEAFKEFLIYKVLADIGLGQETWIKLVYENTDTIEVVGNV